MTITISMVILGALLALTSGSIGCASDNQLRDILARVPSDTVSLKYVDVRDLRNDADLDDLYDAWEAALDSRLNSFGIRCIDVNIFASGTGPDKQFTLVVGKFSMDDVRDELDDSHYVKVEYEGVEVWKKQSGWNSQPVMHVALMGNLIILGNEAGVKSCIKVIKKGNASWLSKVDINDVVTRLPYGLYADLQKADLAGLLISGLEATGISARKLDGDTLRITGVAKFDDEDDADKAENTIENILEYQFSSVHVRQEGIFLKATAELDIDKAKGLFISSL